MPLWIRCLIVCLSFAIATVVIADDVDSTSLSAPDPTADADSKSKEPSKKPAKKKAAKKPAPEKKKSKKKKPTGQPAPKPAEKKAAENQLPEPKTPPSSKPAPVDRTKEATTDLAKVDADFALQGEYMGRPATVWKGAEHVGLQVIALGDGQFDAYLLRGGLPGAGWDRKAKDKLTGKREQDRVTLANDAYEIAVTGKAAEVRQRAKSGASHRIATLEKYHRVSSTLDAPPAAGAIVLFDGRETDQLQDAKLTSDGLLEVGVTTKRSVGDFQLHIEFRTPYMPFARGQGRGNSGIYIQQRYEVQVLDSFGLPGEDNECGGLYKQKPPAVNMCLPPLSWQTYDIYFYAARWSSTGEKLAPARITVLHNGEPIHLNYELTNKTGGGKAESREAFPILLQNHGNPVHYRNVWIIPGDSRGDAEPLSVSTAAR